MTSLIISIVLWLISQGSPNRIAERNRLKQQAEQAFLERDFTRSAAFYRRLSESAIIPESGVMFNLAQAYFSLGNAQQARVQYERLTRVSDPGMAASALSQLGVLACQSGDSTAALGFFRRSLEVSPGYETARYNYELLRKNRPATAPPPTSRESPKASSVSPPPVSGQAMPTETHQDFLNRLRRYDLSEEKARMLLDAMRASEIQYIQQRSYRGEGVEMKQTW
ncbi:MAG: tetratricopeptide repeat protein [Sphingobacteriaceae bacterium]|nr:tetratricopeptide repeat protein [Cytophagaceae bacterium]